MILTPIVAAVLIGVYWLQSVVPKRFYWEAALAFLAVSEVLFVTAALAAALGLPVAWWLLLRGRRGHHNVHRRLQWLLLCASVLLGIIVAEVGAAAWQRRASRYSAVPTGGLRKAAGSTDKARFKAPADIPLRTKFDDPPDDKGIDLVVLGESSAEGVPFERWVSVGGILRWELEKALAGREVRSHILATAGMTLEWQQGALAELPVRPDLLVIYAGHNEFSSRLAPTRDLDYYFDERLPTPWGMLVDWTEQTSPVCRLIAQTREKCKIALPPQPRRTLVDVPVYTSTEFTALLVDFRRRLERIVSYAEQLGAVIVLILPAANEARFEPNRSFLPATTTRSEREAFARDFLEVRQSEAKNPEAAIARYRSLLARQPGFAETSYRLARLLEEKGEWDEAYRHYVAARDQDGYPLRLPLVFQDVYREVASRHDCILIDSQSYFHEIGRHGLLDDELFQDGMHPSLRGQLALAQPILQELHARGAFGWPRDSRIPVLDPAECVQHFRLNADVWHFIAVWALTFNNIVAPLRYDASERVKQKAIYAEAAGRIAAGQPPESVGLPNLGTPAPVPVLRKPLEKKPSSK
jgi:hypothetical protein